MTEEVNKKLKSCPFCGGEEKLKGFRTFISHQHVMGTKYYITCLSCYIDEPGFHLTEEEAITAWNRR